MKRTLQVGTYLLSMLLVGALSACSSSEDQQARYLERAHVHYDAGDYKKAKLELRNVIQINPKNPDARFLRGLIYEIEGDWRSAMKNYMWAVEYAPNNIEARMKVAEFSFNGGPGADKATQEEIDKVLALEPDNPAALSLRARLLYRQGEKEAGIADANRALAAEPGNRGAISLMANEYRASDPARVLAIIEEGIRSNPEDIQLYLIKIQELSMQKDSDGVIKVYKQLIEKHPEDLSYYKGLAAYLSSQGRREDTEALLRDAIKSKPENIEIKLWLAEFLANSISLDVAEATVQEFIAEHPDEYAFRLALARIYTMSGNIQSAKKVYEEIIAKGGDGADALKARTALVGLKLVVEGDVAGAEAMLDEVFAIEANNADALIFRANLKLLRNDPEGAIIDLRTLLKNDPQSTTALNALAQAYEASGSLELALDTYRTLLEISPTNWQAFQKMAQLLVSDGQYYAADQLLVKLLVRNPANADVARLLVESYVKQERWEDALKIADGLENQKQDKVPGLYLKARVHYARKDYAAAKAEFEQVLSLDPGGIEALSLLVQSMRELGEQEKAGEYLAKHIEQHPDHAHAHELQAQFFMDTGAVDSALESYKAALAIEPDRPSSLIAIGQLYQMQNNFPAALESFDRVLQKQKLNAHAQMLKAGVLEAQEQYAAAADIYESLLKMDANNKIAINNLAMLLVDHLSTPGNLQRALAITGDFEDSDVPVFLDTRGWAFYQVGDYVNAKRLLERAVGADKPLDVYRFHLGMTYYKLGDKTAAKRELEAALANGSTFVGAEEALKAL